MSETNFEEAPDCAVYTGHISDIFRNARPPTSADNDPEAESKLGIFLYQIRRSVLSEFITVGF